MRVTRTIGIMASLPDFSQTSRGRRLLGTNLTEFQPDDKNGRPSVNILYLAHAKTGNNEIRPGVTLDPNGKLIIDGIFTDDLFTLARDINARREEGNPVITNIDAFLHVAAILADRRARNIHGYGKHPEEQDGNISEEQKEKINLEIRRALALCAKVIAEFGDNYDHFA